MFPKAVTYIHKRFQHSSECDFSELDFFCNTMKKITSDYWYENEGSPFWHNPLVDLQNIANLANLRTINNIHTTSFFFQFWLS